MAKKHGDPDLNNQDIFVYSLYRLDGAGTFVNVEEVIEECFRLSPSRFGWRTKKVPSDRIGWHALGDLESNRPELTTKTPNGLARQLTAEGVKWVKDRLIQFEALGTQQTQAPKTRRRSHRLLTEVESLSWVREYLDGSRNELTKVQAADILSCAPDSPTSVWQARLTSLQAAAVNNERPDILELLDFVHDRHLGWFGHTEE